MLYDNEYLSFNVIEFKVSIGWYVNFIERFNI